jgi:hypothetical protein
MPGDDAKLVRLADAVAVADEYAARMRNAKPRRYHDEILGWTEGRSVVAESKMDAGETIAARLRALPAVNPHPMTREEEVALMTGAADRQTKHVQRIADDPQVMDLLRSVPAPPRPMGEAPRDDWKPIKDAPKDGRVILVCLPRMMNLIVRARFNTIHKHWLTDCESDGGISNWTYFHPGDMWMDMPAPPHPAAPEDTYEP